MPEIVKGEAHGTSDGVRAFTAIDSSDVFEAKAITVAHLDGCGEFLWTVFVRGTCQHQCNGSEKGCGKVSRFVDCLDRVPDTIDWIEAENRGHAPSEDSELTRTLDLVCLPSSVLGTRGRRGLPHQWTSGC